MPSTLNDDDDKRYDNEKTEKRHQSQINVRGEPLINLGLSTIQEICNSVTGRVRMAGGGALPKRNHCPVL
jgi:hypothetical protein